MIDHGDDDFQPITQEVNPKPQTVLDFIACFDSVGIDTLYEMQNFPTQDEMRIISCLSDEVIIIIDANDKVYVVKGNKKADIDGEIRNHVGMNKKILLDLKPKVFAHTHPASENSQEIQPGTKEYDMALFRESLPSEVDLTDTIKDLPNQYIYNRFGRVTYQAIPNLGFNPQDPNGFSMTQRTIVNALSGPAVEEVKQKGSKNVKDALNILGEYMGRTFNCGFKFETYEELGDKLY